jgi:hypothetical protein
MSIEINMEKIQQLEKIVSETIKQEYASRCKLWCKGTTCRLYLYGFYFYDTKKCKQSAYIDLSTYEVHVDTKCDSQDYAWCESQSRIAEEDFDKKLTRYIRFVAYKLGIIAERRAKIEASPVVKGYYLEWRQVRIPINSYGKLAERNRQFIRAWQGYRNAAPKGFVELSDAEFEAAKKREDEMIAPFETPKFS